MDATEEIERRFQRLEDLARKGSFTELPKSLQQDAMEPQ